MALDLAHIKTMSKEEIAERIHEVRSVLIANGNEKTSKKVEDLTLEKIKRMSTAEIMAIIDEVRAFFERQGKESNSNQGGGQF